MQVKVLHSAILATCTKLPPAFQTFVLSIFEWWLKTGFAVLGQIHVSFSSGDYVSKFEVQGKQMIKVEPEGLTMIAEQAMIDIAHLLRPAHLQVSHTGPCGQSVASQTADPGEGSSIPARPYTFV